MKDSIKIGNTTFIVSLSEQTDCQLLGDDGKETHKRVHEIFKEKLNDLRHKEEDISGDT
jgi:hypothetical protein